MEPALIRVFRELDEMRDATAVHVTVHARNADMAVRNGVRLGPRTRLLLLWAARLVTARAFSRESRGVSGSLAK